MRSGRIGWSEGRCRATARSGPSGGGWPVGVRRLVSAVLIFHIVAILVGALVVAAVVAAGAVAGRPVRALFPADRPGVRVPLLRPRAAADARGDGDDPLRRRPARRDGPAPPQGRVPLAAAAAATGAGQSPATPTSRRPRSRGATASRSRWATLVRPAPGADAPRLLGDRAHRAAAPDPRRRAGSRAPRTRRARRRVDLDAEEFYTTPERIGEYPVRRLLNDLGGVPGRALGGRSRRAWNALLLHPGRPDRAGPDPRGRRSAAVLEPGGLRPRPPRLSRLATAGPTPRSSGSSRASGRRTPGRSGSSSPTPCSARPGSSAWWSWRFTRSGLFSRVDGGARLGDRGLDRAAVAGDALRLRPDRLDPGALPGGHGGERPGGLARPLPGPRPPGARADRRGGAATAAGSCRRGCPPRRSRPTWRCG